VARIPRVVLTLEEAAPDEQVVLDGQILPLAALGIERPIDPGRHVAEVRRGNDRVPREFAVGEGDHAMVVLHGPKASAKMPNNDLRTPYGAPTRPPCVSEDMTHPTTPAPHVIWVRGLGSWGPDKFFADLMCQVASNSGSGRSGWLPRVPTRGRAGAAKKDRYR
jgi:hypothetical protein